MLVDKKAVLFLWVRLVLGWCGNSGLLTDGHGTPKDVNKNEDMMT